MSRVFYEPLSHESAAYLEQESSRQRAHTSMILVFDSGPLATAEGGVDFDRIREIVRMRLAELPRLRTKLRRVPGDGHPVWVDDLEFNLDYHLRQSSLPRPGNHDQLCRTASRIAASRLDRSRPLWDCWVIEGLAGGRFAVVLKMHKALAHLEGADLFRAILSESAEPVRGSIAPYRPRPAPSPVELFTSEVLRRASPTRRLVTRGLGMIARPDRAGRELRDRAAGLLKLLGYRLRPAGESPFDGNLGPHRAFAIQQVDLEIVQQIRQALGGGLDDVVMTILTGALRRFVEELRVSPVSVDLRAVTPMFDADQRLARPFVLELPVWEQDVDERHRLLCEQTDRLRREQEVASSDLLLPEREWTAARRFGTEARALDRIETGQLAVLLSPGPKGPLHLDGARLVESYGILPLQDSSGLGITVLGYDASLFFAFNADPDIVKDVSRVRDAVDSEVASLAGLAGTRGPSLRALGGGRR